MADAERAFTEIDKKKVEHVVGGIDAQFSHPR